MGAADVDTPLALVFLEIRFFGGAYGKEGCRRDHDDDDDDGHRHKHPRNRRDSGVGGDHRPGIGQKIPAKGKCEGKESGPMGFFAERHSVNSNVN